MFMRLAKVTDHIGWSTFEYEGRGWKAICEKENHDHLCLWLEWLVLTELEAKGSSFLGCCQSRSEVKDHESLAYEALLSVILTSTIKHWKHVSTPQQLLPTQLALCSSPSLPSFPFPAPSVYTIKLQNLRDSIVRLSFLVIINYKVSSVFLN